MSARNGQSLWFRAKVCEETAEELSQEWGVERDGPFLMCTPTGLFNLRNTGATLFLADGGAVLVRPGEKMLMFQEHVEK